MKKSILFFLVSILFLLACNKDKSYHKNIQHKWQKLTVELKEDNGNTNSYNVPDSNAIIWTFSDNTFDYYMASDDTSATYSYTIKNEELKTTLISMPDFTSTYHIKSISDKQMVLETDMINENVEKIGVITETFKKID